MMKCRDQRGTLPAVGHIAPPKIAHRGDPGQRCYAVIIPQLQRKGRAPLGLMPDGLSMAADGHNIMGRQPLALQQLIDRLGIQRAQGAVQLAHRRQRRLLPLAHGQDRRLDLMGDGVNVVPLACHQRFIDRGQNHINTVQAGAGHNADIASRFHILFDSGVATRRAGRRRYFVQPITQLTDRLNVYQYQRQLRINPTAAKSCNIIYGFRLLKLPFYH